MHPPEVNLVGAAHQDVRVPVSTPLAKPSDVLKLTFSPVRGTKRQYRVLVCARTKEEKVIGFVEASETNRQKWVNSRNDGRIYRDRELAGRDLLDRRDLGERVRYEKPRWL